MTPRTTGDRLSTLSTLQKVRHLHSAKLYNVFVFDVRIAFAKLWYTSPVNGISVRVNVVLVILCAPDVSSQNKLESSTKI